MISQAGEGRRREVLSGVHDREHVLVGRTRRSVEALQPP
jgi:hypothetical protein